MLESVSEVGLDLALERHQRRRDIGVPVKNEGQPFICNSKRLPVSLVLGQLGGFVHHTVEQLGVEPQLGGGIGVQLLVPFVNPQDGGPLRAFIKDALHLRVVAEQAQQILRKLLVLAARVDGGNLGFQARDIAALRPCGHGQVAPFKILLPQQP